MAHLHLSWLGSPEVWCGRQMLNFATRKVLALLIYLTVEKGLHPREKLATFFWPESDPVRARSALRTTLAHLRRSLDTVDSPGGQAYLIAEADALGFATSSEFELDLHTVTAALDSEQMAALPTVGNPLGPWAPASSDGLLQEAIRLYRGDFLEGFALPDAATFDDWVTFQRQHWHHQMNIAFDRLSQWQSAARYFEEGISTAVRWVAHDSLNEAAHRRLMQLHFLASNKTAALQAYRACRAILAEELAVEPSPETKQMLARIQGTRLGVSNFAFRSERALFAPSRKSNLESTIQNLNSIEIPFVGRTAEHAQLVSNFHMARQGQAQVVLIEGEAGIGKTRLAAEFLAWTEIHGATVLRGRAFEAGGRLPYQPLIEALRRQVERENAPEDLLSDIWLAELSRLLPELHDRYPDLSLATGDESLARTRLLETVARLGQAMAARAPVVLFIDDIQWTDSASLDVLHYCGRAWTESHTPILLLLTIRSEALTGPQAASGSVPSPYGTIPVLIEWLSGLGRDVSLTRLALGSITADETQQLVQSLAGEQGGRGAGEMISSSPPPSFARWLFTETAGQPFYLTEMIKTLIEQGFLHLRPGDNPASSEVWTVDWQPAASLPPIIPPSVRELILTRLHRLTSNARALLTAAAVIGRNCTFERLCQMTNITPSEGLPALDELLAGRLLVETGDLTGPLTFGHDKIRDVVYTDAGTARRRLYHGQAFAVLEETGTPAELAHHALAAQLTEPAFRYSLAAGDAAMDLFAVRDAIAHYEQAHGQWSAFRDRLSFIDHVEHLYLRLGRAYELMGDYRQAQSVFQEMLALARSLDRPELACIALNRLATVATHAYEFDAATAWLKEALAVAEESGNKAALAETEWSLAQLAYHCFDYPATLLHSRRTLALARELDNQELIAGSLNTLAYAECLLGQLSACQAHMKEAKTLYATLGNRALEADCLTIIGYTSMLLGQTDAGIEDARTAYTISQEIDNPWGQIHSSSVLAFGLTERGDYEVALYFVEKGAQQAHAHQLVHVNFLNLLSKGIVQRMLLALDPARAVHQEAADLCEKLQSASFAGMVAAELCVDCALAEEWEAATGYARQALALRNYNALTMVISPHWPQTEALLRAGEVGLAREDARRWGDLVDHIPRFRLFHLRSLALLAQWDGDRQQAITHLQEALALAEEGNLPGEQWQILAKLGELYYAEDDAERAQQVFAQAAEIVQLLAANIDNADLRTQFLAAAPVQRVFAGTKSV